MVWAVILLGTVIALAILEWRSWKKPLAHGLEDWAGGNPYRGGDRGLTGGHTFDERHD
jgi:hypothetical protein